MDGNPEDELTIEQVLELREFSHLTKGTLAQWRCLHKGPAWFKIGRKTFYTRGAIERWKRAQELQNEIAGQNITKLPGMPERRPQYRMPNTSSPPPSDLPVQETRWKHPTGGHKTKRDREEEMQRLKAQSSKLPGP